MRVLRKNVVMKSDCEFGAWMRLGTVLMLEESPSASKYATMWRAALVIQKIGMNHHRISFAGCLLGPMRAAHTRELETTAATWLRRAI